MKKDITTLKAVHETDRLTVTDKAQLILDAATPVFLQHGFSAATTDTIQRAAGMSKATVYACFPSKEALFAAVIERECAAMAATVGALEASAGDIGRTLTDLGLSYLRMVLSPTGLALFRVVIGEAPRFPELARRFYLAGPRTMTAVIARRLGQAAAAGEIDLQAVGVDAAASLFISLLRGEGHLECLAHPDATPSAEQLDRWVKLAVQAFLAAFGVPGAK